MTTRTILAMGLIFVLAVEPGWADAPTDETDVFVPPEPQAEAEAPATATARKGKLSLLTLYPDLSPHSDYRGDLWHRSTLFGDVAGWRQRLYDRGVVVDLDLTQVAQGVVSGGDDKTWRYDGSADYYLFLDSGRLDLWPGGLFAVHAETKYARSVISQAGTASPVNADYLWPDPSEHDVTFLSEYYHWQRFTDWFLLAIGRMDWTAVSDRNRFANHDRTQFLNSSLRNSPLLGTFLPLTAHGFSPILQVHPALSIVPLVISQSDEPDVYGSPSGPFDEVTAGLELDFSWNVLGLAGSMRPLAAFGSRSPVDLNNDRLARSVLDRIVVEPKNNNYIFHVNVEQYLYMVDRGGKRLPKLQTARFEIEPEGIGFFGRYSYTPASRNPWNMFASGGFGGRGVIPGRSRDRYGVGLYALIESDKLRSQPALGGRLDAEIGFEAYYNLSITPWLELTPDIQYIASGVPGVADSLVIGTRLQMYF